MQRYTAPDGVSIAVYQWNEGGRGSVVLHHGYAASAALNWVGPGIVDALVRAGRHVVAVDARGHGESDKPHDSALYGESNMARDLLGVVAQLGLREFDLVGYSMGAIVALIAAAQRPAGLRRLAVGGVGEGVVVCGGVDSRVLPPRILAESLEADAPAPDLHPGAAAMVAFVSAIGGDRKALAAQARAVHAAPIALERIAVPTLLLAGSEDPLAMRPEQLAQAIPGARLELVSGDHLTALGDPRFVAALIEHTGPAA